MSGFDMGYKEFVKDVGWMMGYIYEYLGLLVGSGGIG